ncbi:MAG: TIGR00730 family Rossman fold protein [Rhizobiaceae bacterium]|nr:TIGR00730 family Rossman fold protein [Rhizobiaceae bacterium]
MPQIKSICVYCGSSSGTEADFVKTAHILGETLSARGIRLVYGGGTNGLMGAVAKGAHTNGGSVTGIIPQFLLEHEAANNPSHYCDEVIVCETMHERKHLMFEKADAFVTLPGGIGTLEEVVEMMTWSQLGRHEKPIFLLNTNWFWDPFIELIQHMEQSGFLHQASKAKPIIAQNVEEIIEHLGQ